MEFNLARLKNPSLGPLRSNGTAGTCKSATSPENTQPVFSAPIPAPDYLFRLAKPALQRITSCTPCLLRACSQKVLAATASLFCDCSFHSYPSTRRCECMFIYHILFTSLTLLCHFPRSRYITCTHTLIIACIVYMHRIVYTIILYALSSDALIIPYLGTTFV